MYVFLKVHDLKKYLTIQRQNGLSIGFVPTMGALHEGHMSLISQARENDLVVCSVFVNPKQFDDTSDLDKYPRTILEDTALLFESKCSILFCPSVPEIYPPDLVTDLNLDLGHLSDVMEGEFRPGHFNGMVEVVHRLLQIVGPDKLYMGQKDYQQFTIVEHMINQLNLDVALVMCPIVREVNGLAMSSRNRRLNGYMKNQATIIYQTLQRAKKRLLKGRSIQLVEKEGLNKITEAGLRPEYLTVVNGRTLEHLDSLTSVKRIVICAAAWAGNVRLIDNIVVKND